MLSGNQNPKLQHYAQTKSMMCETANIEPSKLQQLVILVHATCTFHQLQCINQEQEKCEFPLNWHQSSEGVYKFTYIIPSGIYKDKIVQFRLVDTGDALSINFVVQNTENLHSVQIAPQDKTQDTLETLSKEIAKLLQPNSVNSSQNDFQQRERPRPFLQPVPLQYQPVRPVNDRPVPFDIGPGTIPIGSPFTRQEYIGPNSGLFAGRGGQGPRFPTGNRVPNGARWDPVDPFGEQGPDNTNEFFGFNQWEQPKFNPNRPNQFGKGGNGFF